jgi:acyl-CoA thioesterase
VENIKKFFKNDWFAEHVGIELLEVSKGYAKAKLEIRNEHLNSVGTVHGGAIFALADLVFAVASNSHGTIAMGINVSISYLKAVREGTIFAEAKEISRNPKLASYTVTVSDQSGDTIAIFQGMVYRKKDKLPVPAKE